MSRLATWGDRAAQQIAKNIRFWMGTGMSLADASAKVFAASAGGPKVRDAALRLVAQKNPHYAADFIAPDTAKVVKLFSKSGFTDIHMKKINPESKMPRSMKSRRSKARRNPASSGTNVTYAAPGGAWITDLRTNPKKRNPSRPPPADAVFFATTKGDGHQIIVVPEGSVRGIPVYDFGAYSGGEKWWSGSLDIDAVRSSIALELPNQKYVVKINKLGQKANPRYASGPYAERVKLPGWTGKTNLEHATAPRIRAAFGSTDHEAALEKAIVHANAAARAYNRTMKAAIAKHGDPQPWVSGIGSGSFPEATKKLLRKQLDAFNRAQDAAGLHYKAMGKRTPFYKSEYAHRLVKAGGYGLGSTKSNPRALHDVVQEQMRYYGQAPKAHDLFGVSISPFQAFGGGTGPRYWTAAVRAKGYEIGTLRVTQKGAGNYQGVFTPSRYSVKDGRAMQRGYGTEVTLSGASKEKVKAQVLSALEHGLKRTRQGSGAPRTRQNPADKPWALAKRSGWDDNVVSMHETREAAEAALAKKTRYRPGWGDTPQSVGYMIVKTGKGTPGKGYYDVITLGRQKMLRLNA